MAYLPSSSLRLESLGSVCDEMCWYCEVEASCQDIFWVEGRISRLFAYLEKAFSYGDCCCVSLTLLWLEIWVKVVMVSYLCLL